jgi:ABC-type uncharacterized transport system permease subunit
MKDKQNYQVKTPKGFIAIAVEIHANGQVIKTFETVGFCPSFADCFNYQDACQVAFDLNKQHNALDYAVIETAETV